MRRSGGQGGIDINAGRTHCRPKPPEFYADSSLTTTERSGSERGSPLLWPCVDNTTGPSGTKVNIRKRETAKPVLAMQNSNTSGQPQKLALTRVEAAMALNMSPASLDRLTTRGLLRPSRATRRPLYAIKELERYLQDTKGGI